MRNFAIMLAPVLMLGMLRGQDKPAVPETPSGPLETAIIHVKALDENSFDRLFRLLKVFDAKISADNQLRTILVYGRPNEVAQIRHVIEELDRPGSEATFGRNVQMTLTFLRCSTKAPATPKALPADLESVAKQLMSATQYKDIALWEVLPLHLQEGRITTETLRLPRGAESPDLHSPEPPTASIRIRPDAVYSKDQTRYIRFEQLNVNIKIPFYTGNAQAGQWNFSNVNLETTGDFAEGQKTVLGKLSGLDDESAIFIVVALKVLD
jgi:hypothetical protein